MAKADDFDVVVRLDAVEQATANPDVTLMFEAGANKLMTGFGHIGGKPCLVMTAVPHNGQVGDEALLHPRPTAAIVFNSSDTAKLMMRQLSAIIKEFKNA